MSLEAVEGGGGRDGFLIEHVAAVGAQERQCEHIYQHLQLEEARGILVAAMIHGEMLTLLGPQHELFAMAEAAEEHLVGYHPCSEG